MDEVRLATASYQTFRPEYGEAVKISVGFPKWPLPYEVKHEVGELKPFGLLTDPPLSRDDFRRAYFDRLEDYGPERIAERFEAIATDKPLVLLCFCRYGAGAECHRRVFAAWWWERVSMDVPEVGPNLQGTLL